VARSPSSTVGHTGNETLSVFLASSMVNLRPCKCEHGPFARTIHGDGKVTVKRNWMTRRSQSL
jgi:hypothetical protein